MDFTQIDKLISALEKGASLRPGSPPVVISGHLGIWRTVRHNRMFLELLDGGKKQGKVLIGPPSFVGNTLGDVPNEVWANLTPKATLKEFSGVSVAGNGIDTLKQAIKNAVGPEDSRREAVDNFSTKLQLVPIARSAGFTDAEIKSALSGKSPNEALSSKEDGPSARAPSGDTDVPKTKVTAVRGRRVAPEVTPGAETPDASKPETKKPEPTKPTPKTNDTAFINDALARVLQPTKAVDSEENAKKIGELLVRLSEKDISDKLLAKEVAKLGHGLRSGDFSITEAKEKLKNIVEDRERVKRNIKVTDAQIDALSDKAEVKEFIDDFDKKIDEAVAVAVKDLKGKFTPEAKPETKPAPSAKPDVKPDDEAKVKTPPAAKPEAKPETKPTPVAPKIDVARVQENLSSLTTAQQQNVQEQAIINLLNILKKNLKSAEALKSIKQIETSIHSGNYNKKSIIFQLYKLIKILALLIPGI